jgi:ribosome-associated protein
LARKSAKKDPARELALAAAKIAHDDNCEEIAVLDLRGISPVTDYFVIVTGTSDRQMRSVADDIAEHGKSIGQRVWRVTGKESAEWIILDFVDVVVHVFDQTHRHYYDLELIWGEGPRVDWRKAVRRRKMDRPAAPAGTATAPAEQAAEGEQGEPTE